MNIIDLHCDTIAHFFWGKHLKGLEDSHINLEKLQEGDVLLQCFAIFVPTGNETRIRDGKPVSPETYFEDAYRAYLREMELNADVIRPVKCVSDIERNRAEGKISAMLTVEDAVTLNGRIEEVDEYFRKGVRMVALTWNYENSLGHPNSPDPELHTLGLKPFGIEAVRRMNDLGIIVDVSHLSEGGFWDVARISRVPFIASHSCCRALRDHQRNLTDEQLRAVANAGGIVGMNYCDNFLHPRVPGEALHTDLSDIIRHFEHLRQVAGDEVPAMGSDYDGIDAALEWKDAAGNVLVEEALNRAFPASLVDRITHENALRVFRDVIG